MRSYIWNNIRHYDSKRWMLLEITQTSDFTDKDTEVEKRQEKCVGWVLSLPPSPLTHLLSSASSSKCVFLNFREHRSLGESNESKDFLSPKCIHLHSPKSVWTISGGSFAPGWRHLLYNRAEEEIGAIPVLSSWSQSQGSRKWHGANPELWRANLTQDQSPRPWKESPLPAAPPSPLPPPIPSQSTKPPALVHPILVLESQTQS